MYDVGEEELDQVSSDVLLVTDQVVVAAAALSLGHSCKGEMRGAPAIKTDGEMRGAPAIKTKGK